LLVEFGQAAVEIVVGERHREVGRAIDNTDAEIFQGHNQFLRTVHIEGFDADAAGVEILLCDFRRQAEARPESGHRARGRRRRLDQIASVGQALQRLLNFVRRKLLRELADQRGAALAVLADAGGDCAIQSAVQEEFPVFGVEADALRRQNIDGKICCELQNVPGCPARRAGLAFGFHRISTRIPVLRGCAHGGVIRRRNAGQRVSIF
jgi:hypothetical protein